MKTNKQSVNIIQFFAIKIFSAAILLLCIWAALQSGLTLQAKAGIVFPANDLTIEVGEEVYPNFDLSEGLMLYGYTIKDSSQNVVVSEEYDYRLYSSPGNGNPFTITKAGTYTISWTFGGYSLVVVGGHYDCKPNYSNVGTLSQSFRVISSGSGSSYSGSCGDNLTWYLNTGTGKLTISGTGKMWDWDYWEVPWHSYRSSIKTVSIGNGVTSIGSSAFYNCGSLTSVTIPDSVTSIGSNAFFHCSSLTSISVSGNNAKYASQDGVLFNKDKTSLIRFPCGKSGAYTIPNGVTSIEDYAFHDCTSLTSVTIPDSVTGIPHGAFRDCSSLTSVSIGKGVQVIEDAAFSGCGLISVVIPDSVTYINYEAFRDCSSLTSVTIPHHVTMGTNVFTHCHSLTSVTIPDGFNGIPYATFADCTSLKSITIPSSVTSIGDWAFSDCNLTKVIYCGTSAQWNKITIGSHNDPLFRATRTYHTEHSWSDEPVGIPATCTSAGKKTYTCTVCGQITTETIPALGHSYDSKVTTAATCTAAGLRTYTCSRNASHTYTETISSLGHNLVHHNAQAATCTQDGWREYEACTRCDYTTKDEVSALGHSFTNYKSDGNATCVKDGTKTATCDRCSAKDTVTDVGSKNYAEHKPGEDTDCTKQSKCTLCGKVLREAGSHSWNSGRITTSATCTAAGVKTYSCTACGATKTETVSATGHSWNNGEITTAATCTKQGVKTYTCMACGATRADSISATGHGWNKGEITTAATCATQGVKTYTCTKCGETKMEAVSALGHSWSKEKVVLQKPTVSATGMKAYVCTRCREQQGNESIPMLVPTIRVANGRGCPGRTAEVKLVISDNPGIAGAILKLDYAAGLTLQTIKVGDAVPGLEYTPPGNLSGNSVNLVWDGLDADDSNGTMLTLTFAIGAEVPEGDYPVTISCEPGGIYDGKTEDVVFTLKQGKISVRNTLIADLNDDYAINVKDVTLLRRYIAGGYGFTPKDEAVADVNGDGVCNTRDITFLRRCLAGGFGIELS